MNVHELIFRVLIRVYPATFRRRFGEQLIQTFGDQLTDARAASAPAGVASLWMRTLVDLGRSAASEHLDARTTTEGSARRSPAARVLGIGGVIGGTLLLSAFVMEIAAAWNPARLALFNAGAIAVILGLTVGRAQRLSRGVYIAAIAGIVANAAYLGMVLLATTIPRPFAGDFGYAFFIAGLAMWLADAAFGAVALRRGIGTTFAAAALVLGSVLAATGLDRLELTGPGHETIFGPLSLLGIALNGAAWIALGASLALGARRSAIHP